MLFVPTNLKPIACVFSKAKTVSIPKVEEWRYWLQPCIDRMPQKGNDYQIRFGNSGGLSRKGQFNIVLICNITDCIVSIIDPCHIIDPVYLPPANVVCEGYIFTGVCHSFCSQGACVVIFGGGMRGFIQGGMHGFIWGGMHGFIQGGMCGFIQGRCAWFYSGGGHAWFHSGGMHGFIQGVCVVWFGGGCGFIWGGMHGFIQGACMVLFGGHAWFYSGGACVVFSVFSDTMRYGQWAGGTHPTGMHSCSLYSDITHGVLVFPDSRRLLMKCSIHLMSLEALLETFPDACLIYTVRPVSEVVPSYCSNVQHLHNFRGECTSHSHYF